MSRKLDDANELLSTLKNAVVALDHGETLPILIEKVCKVLDQDRFKENPLFATTIESLREGEDKI